MVLLMVLLIVLLMVLVVYALHASTIIGWFNTKLPHLVVLKELSHTQPTLEMISFLPFKMLQVLLARLMPINDIQQE
jgi:hypothetical protein